MTYVDLDLVFGLGLKITSIYTLNVVHSTYHQQPQYLDSLFDPIVIVNSL
jgi:hypothetical protein